MKFEIIDQIHATKEEREAIYRKLEDHGFMIDEEVIFDEEEDDIFTHRYIEINSLEELMKLNKVLGYPVGIDGSDLNFLETL